MNDIFDIMFESCISKCKVIENFINLQERIGTAFSPFQDIHTCKSNDKFCKPKDKIHKRKCLFTKIK